MCTKEYIEQLLNKTSFSSSLLYRFLSGTFVTFPFASLPSTSNNDFPTKGTIL